MRTDPGPERFDPAAFKGKTACVLGLGRSGLAAARLLSRKGFRVLASDSRPRRELRAAAARLPRGARWEGGGHSDKVLRCAFAVKSPGIPRHAPVLEKLAGAGIPVFSELEVAVSLHPGREIVAVTGTNGKTTTVHLTAAVFKAARRRARMAGNVGAPLCEEAAKTRRGDTLVVEASSYQLEDSRWFRPASAALLNLTPDHLDHHGGMDAYLKAKARIFLRQGPDDDCIFNAADPLVMRLSRECPSRRLLFSLSPSAGASAWVEGGKILLRLPGEKTPTAVEPPRIPGDHNLENAMAAALLARSRGVPVSAVRRAFRAFRGVEHRIEDCGKVRGMSFINDSNATNVDSTLAALKSLSDRSGKILLVLGGLAKPGGFAGLRGPVERQVKAVLTIGSAAEAVEEALRGAAHCFPCGTLEEAVRTALKIGLPGETLLLSPACASFDQFSDFEDRGRAFKRLAERARRGRL